MKILLCTTLVVLFLFGSSGAQYRDNVRRHTAAERMEANDKRTAQQAARAPAVGGPGFFSAWDVSHSKAVDKIVRRYSESLATNKDVIAPYERLLNDKNFKMLRLFESFECDAKTLKVTQNSQICNSLSGGGGNAFFSFRKGLYGYRDLSDIEFSNGEIVASGELNKGMLIDLGPIPIESVDLSNPAILAIKKVEHWRSFKEPRQYIVQKSKEIVVDGFTFLPKVESKPGHTFVGRFIAYNADWMEFYYNIKGLGARVDDRRKDVIIVFRVLSIEKDGGPVVIWRELASADSPKLRAEPNDE